MKKVLFVIYSYSLGGGAEKILCDIVNHLDFRKYDITIQPYADFGFPKGELPPHVRLCPGIVNMDKAGRVEKFVKHVLVHFLPEVLRKIYIREHYDFEIAFNYQIPSFLVKETKKTKAIEWNHGDVYDLRDKRIKRALQKRSYRRATRIVVISENTKQSVCELFPEFADKLELIYNGVNISRIEEMAMEDTGIILKSPAIAFVGRLEEAKRPMLLIEAVRDLCGKDKEVHLYFVGQGEQEDLIRKKAAEWKLEENVHLLGYQKNPYPIMRQCNAVCMLSRSEGFPTVFTEGMALGKPFVSSAVGGVKELSNTGECGVIVRDIKECINAIEEVVLNEERNRRMGEACRVYVKNFSMDRQIEMIGGLLDRLQE